jgi:hypothetical protein
MSRTTHDYPLLERAYITSDVSIRQLCVDNGIKNWSSVSTMAKKLDWERKRADYKEAQFKHDINTLAQRRAHKLQEVYDDLVSVIQATIMRMAANLASEDYHVSVRDLGLLIEKLQLLTGGATSREEVLNLNLSTDLPPELLRELQNAARRNGAGSSAVGQSALPVAEGPRQVN